MAGVIKTRGVLDDSEQRIFPDSPRSRKSFKLGPPFTGPTGPHIWGVDYVRVFDFPGEFSSYDNISFQNVSFRELNGDFRENKEVFWGSDKIAVADVSYRIRGSEKALLMGRTIVTPIHKGFLENDYSNLHKFLKSSVGIDFADDELERISEPFERALKRWSDDFRYRLEKKLGLPRDVFISSSEEHDIAQVGFLNPAYLDRSVFATPYITTNYQTLADRLCGAGEALIGRSPIVLRKTGKLTRKLDRLNITTSNIEVPEVISGEDRQMAEDYFSGLRMHLTTLRPTVPIDGQDDFRRAYRKFHSIDRCF